MILPFSTKINGKPSHFVSKIYAGFSDETGFNEDELIKFAYNCNRKGLFIKDIDCLGDLYDVTPKIQTIREDKHDRWKVGNKIHFTINNRTKNSFQFAPVLLVKSIQQIRIERVDEINDSKVFIDGREITLLSELKTLARNDGFETLISFWLFFDYSFTGKIIHWTDFKY